MPKLYFMQREFSGRCWAICDMLEDEAFRKSLVFEDSWCFLHYRFFGRDCVCSETSATVQTHLYPQTQPPSRTSRGWKTRYPAASRRFNPDENPSLEADWRSRYRCQTPGGVFAASPSAIAFIAGPDTYLFAGAGLTAECRRGSMPPLRPRKLRCGIR